MRVRMIGVASAVAVVVAACTPTVLQSVSSSGTQGNGESLNATVSGDGHLIAFSGPSTNLVAGDTNGHWDVFVHDATADTTTRVSVGKNAVQANADSGGSARPSL